MRARLASRRPLYALIAFLALVLLAGCHTDSMRGMHGAPGQVEGSLQDTSLADFYKANCASCHGADRRGGIGPALTPDRLVESDDFYFDAIARGRPGTLMPGWSDAGLTDSDIRALIAFLRTPSS